jgi:hypothetical protein
MAVRKSLHEKVVVNGDRSQLLAQCKRAMEKGGFKKITVSEVLFQVSGKYSKVAAPGSLQVTLTPVGGGTELAMRSTAATDNIYAVFRSPNQRLLRAFKDNL